MKRILFISGSMGLGHVIRDIAIADKIACVNKKVEIIWLANGPAAKEIKRVGGVLHKRWEEFADLNTEAESVVKGFSLQLSDYGRVSRPRWESNYRLFCDILTNEEYEVAVGDETYGIWFHLDNLHDQINTPFVMIYDFVGFSYLTFMQRLKNLLHGKRSTNEKQSQDHKRIKAGNNSVLFIGEDEDISDSRFGFLLPNRRRYAQKHYFLIGYVLNFSPGAIPDRNRLKKVLGYGDNPLIICAIGGTSVGRQILDLCSSAYVYVKDEIPDLQMVLVCGPRLDPASVKVSDGIEVKGYVPKLYEHFAASDLVITQAGGTATLELTALKVPFIYFPIEGHEEQETHVSKRLERHHAGVKMLFTETDPLKLAQKVLQNINKPVSSVSIPIDGAQKAAETICSFL